MFVKFTTNEINYINSALTIYKTASTPIILQTIKVFENYNSEAVIEIHGKELNCLYTLIWKADHAENIELWNGLLELIENLLIGWNGR